jgi:preprotein translocase subunit YajC
LGYLIVIVALFALFWLLVLRPQRRRQFEQLQMQDSLHVGDEVITAGGIRGHVRRFDDDEVLGVEIAPGVEVRLDRRAVAGVVKDEPEEEPEEQAREQDAVSQDGSSES